MTHREAVIMALSHREVHPIPYQLDMTALVRERMVRETGDPLYFEHSGSYLAVAGNETFEDLGGGTMRDMFGVVWDRTTQEGDFGIIPDYRLKTPSLAGYTFPEPDEAHIRRQCEKLLAQPDQFKIYNVGFSLFERAWTLRSMQELLCDMLQEPDFVDELLDRITAYNLAVVDIAAQYPIDAVLFGDDWGMQRGLIMGYPLWKRFIHPRVTRMYAHVKSKGLYVGQHSCGDCRQVFPDLAAAGLDFYNTFQPEVYDIEEFKCRFGDRITFYGGISTQALLPFVTPEELDREMRRIMGILGRDGGYIIAPTHAMPNDIPTENVRTFLRVCQNQG